jgi:hypothetical protein
MEWLADPQAWMTLSFLLLIGAALIGDGFDMHISIGNYP